MLTSTRRLQFCAGHVVDGYENPCAFPHGHNYVASIEATLHADALDAIERVVDFSVLNDQIGGWIAERWDHGFIVPANASHQLDVFVAALKLMRAKVYVLDSNPTPENLARYLARKVCPTVLEGTGVSVTRVTVWETEHSFAVCEVSPQ